MSLGLCTNGRAGPSLDGESKMLSKQIVTSALSSTLLACAGVDSVPPTGVSRDATSVNDCISAASIRDYRVLDDFTLLVDVVHQRHYQVTLVRPAAGLRFADRLGFAGRGGRICSGLGEIVVRDGHSTTSIRVDTVFRVPESRLAALTDRNVPAPPGPDLEQGSTPGTAGAELEELD